MDAVGQYLVVTHRTNHVVFATYSSGPIFACNDKAHAANRTLVLAASRTVGNKVEHLTVAGRLTVNVIKLLAVGAYLIVHAQVRLDILPTVVTDFQTRQVVVAIVVIALVKTVAALLAMVLIPALFVAVLAAKATAFAEVLLKLLLRLRSAVAIADFILVAAVFTLGTGHTPLVAPLYIPGTGGAGQ